MARMDLFVVSIVLAGACSHKDATAPDRCEAEMQDQQTRRGAPTSKDYGATFQRWTYITSQSPNYIVLFDWSSGHCVVSYP